jgi:hypothetical protein
VVMTNDATLLGRSLRVGKLNRLASRKTVIFIHSREDLKSQTTKTIYAVGLISKN